MVNLKSQAAPTNTILENAEEDGNFTQLIDALNAAGLADTLNGSGPFTVFAPTDAAFEEANDTLAGIDEANLTDLLLYHVVAGDVMSMQLESGMTLNTLQGDDLTVIINETGTFINDAMVVQADIDSTNGVIHAIDSVLQPRNVVETIDNQSDLSMLADLLDRANLTDALNGTGPFTVFAPSNEAFEMANQTMLQELTEGNNTENLTQLLTYHVVPGRIVLNETTENQTLTTLQGQKLVLKNNDTGFYVNDAMISESNLIATNGVVHVIDEVLETPESIAQIVKENENFSSLEAALEAAGLMETLNGSGPFTVFAPTDDAFDEIDPALLDWLLTQDTDTLSQILRYHVVAGEVYSWQLEDNTTLNTLEGSPLNVTVMNTTDGQTMIMVGNATILISDIVASNGVIHVIDAVLLPPSLNATVPVVPVPVPVPVPVEPTPEQPAPQQPEPCPPPQPQPEC